MKQLILILTLAISLGSLLSGSALPTRAADSRAALGHLCDDTSLSRGPQSATCMVQRRVTILREVRDMLRKEAAGVLPPDLPAAELAEARRYTAWLVTWADRLDALGLRGNSALGKTGQTGGEAPAQVFQATKEMQEQQLSFNFQYLELSKQMDNEHRQFTLVSNILKTKFDTIDKSIDCLVAGR